MPIATIDTPLGTAAIVGDENGISSISLSEETPSRKMVPPVLQEAAVQLKEYFLGERTEFEFPLSPKGTEFQKKVWQALLMIPYGKTVSYLSLAKELGDTKAIRAVAAANGKNPLWVVIPCHRVIGSDRSLTGYAGGLWRKKWLLEHENPIKQTILF